MWHFKCNGIEYEFHNEETAMESLQAHREGYEPLGYMGCPIDHQISDDGEPCWVPNCQIPYVPETVKGELT